MMGEDQHQPSLTVLSPFTNIWDKGMDNSNKMMQRRMTAHIKPMLCPPMFLRFWHVAKDIANDPDMRLPQSAQSLGIKPAHITELLNRLNFYGSDMVANPSPSTQSINQASVFTHLVPVIHLLRLFYGYDPVDILTKPM